MKDLLERRTFNMITPALETCKLLKDKGWTKVSKLLWVDNEEWGIHLELWDGHEPNNYIACAPTAEEIAEELPKEADCFLRYKNMTDILDNIFGSENWTTTEEGLICIAPRVQTAENMAKWWIMATWWIWCVDNGYIKPKEG